ncbi:MULTISPECIES: hypothetical protein [Pseudanabaena]|uniref:Uncharacterized protein n=2 Tax=Pseudanabaena TaxID=1152 RepID=L8MRL2_9CYAN|nr:MULTISPECIES: hypothetical protein [Pseudanabaena]ELS30552.1 hypothetical protein Pse7429DRAFT_4324 [Pseudanabaena biceps PCC 7429]MDG3497174.1 hypothetical protein [Pseudanabaena catenata USMAC16]
MTSEITNKLSQIETALLSLAQSVQTLTEESQSLRQELRSTNSNINNLVEHLYARRDVVANDVVDIKDEIYQIKEVTKQQNSTAERYAISAQTQAESIRLLIDMLNRKQA